MTKDSGSTRISSISSPALKRVNPQEAKSEPTSFERISIYIESVHYYSRDSGPHCAVLLNVCFDSDAGILKSAKLPLVALNAQKSVSVGNELEEDDTELGIEIYESHPSRDERIDARKENVTRRTTMNLTPTVGIPSGPNIGVGSITQQKETTDTVPLNIQLSPHKQKYRSVYTQLTWKFKGHKRVDYPSNIRLLVIVYATRSIMTEPSGSFPFRLYIPRTGLSVKVHGWNLVFPNFILRKHTGWCFDITDTFMPQGAQKALKEKIKADSSFSKSNRQPSLAIAERSLGLWAAYYNSGDPNNGPEPEISEKSSGAGNIQPSWNSNGLVGQQVVYIERLNMNYFPQSPDIPKTGWKYRAVNSQQSFETESDRESAVLSED